MAMKPTLKSPKPRASPWESFSPEQLSGLARSFRKAGMRETENPQECQRLFRKANLLRGAAKLKAKRLAKAKSPGTNADPAQ